MLTSLLDAVTRTPRRALATAAVATVIAALPATAHARPHFSVDVSVPVVVDPCPPQPVVYDREPTRVWVEPVYRTACDRQWVPATYRTVDARVWVPPVTASAPQRTFVPDQFGWQTVVARDGWGRPFRTRQWAVIVPAHYEDRCDATAVVTPGHFECVPQQQLVCEGHWEACYASPPAPRVALRVRLPF